MMKMLVLLAGIMAISVNTTAQADVLPPRIEKLGTVTCDLVEATPIVYHNHLYRFESVRKNYAPNTTGDAFFHFVDMKTGVGTLPFAKGFHLGSAFVNKGTMYVFGVPVWGASSITQFTCRDQDLKNWESHIVVDLPTWNIFNTSVCKGRDGYVLAFEIGAPTDETGVPFTIRFAMSKDMTTWTLTPSDHVYSRDRYTACPTIRYLDGAYYMVYLEAYPGPEYDPCIVRSKDLITWESSPFNPMMKHSDEDRRIAEPTLTPVQRAHIAKAKNINNSDVDFCEYKGKTVIIYSWGDQQGTEFLALAEYGGCQNDFLKKWFPKK